MGYLVPGNRFKRFGDTLLNADTANQINKIPAIHALSGGSLTRNSDRVARAKTASADISRTAPTFNDPRYSFTTLSIPTDLRTLNGLYRFFDDTDPVVGNCIRLHTEFPLSRISTQPLADPAIQRHYDDMWERLQLNKLLFDIGLEYWRIGNVFLFGAWNADELMWDQFVVLNPDYVTVEGTYLNQQPLIKLQPDEHLKKIIQTGQPKMLYDQLPPEVIKYVRMGQEIPLSPNNVFHISHNRSPYETLGRSIIKRILKSLIYEDRMSMANFAIATRQVIPITVVKVGDPNFNWLPEDDELSSIQEMFAAREIDPNMTIFYHWGIDVQFYGAAGKIFNLTGEFNRIMKWKFIGLGVSEAILTGGGSYATAYAQLEVLRQRYMHFQVMLEHWLTKGVYEPVAKACGFYKTNALTAGAGYIGRKHGKMIDSPAKTGMVDNETFRRFSAEVAPKAISNKVEYIYPKVDWDLLSLSNDVQYRNFLMHFDKLFPGARKISDATFYSAAKLDQDTEREKLMREFDEQYKESFDKAKITEEWKDKFAKAGLPFMPQGAPPGAPMVGGGAPGAGGAPGIGGVPGGPGAPGSTPGPGGMVTPPGGVPPMGGTGGGNVAGAPAMVPNAPLGRNNFVGNPGEASARATSVKLHNSITAAASEVVQGLADEVQELRAANQELGIPIEEIDDATKPTQI